MKNTTNPPKLLIRFFRWFCHPDLVKYIEGDLIELFEERVVKIGQRKAKWLFVWDVVKLFRPSIIRPVGGAYRLNQLGVFKSHLKTSVRSLKKNVLFSGINIVGLAISMSVGILMIVLLSELYSFDEFHEKKNRIYRVTTTREALFQGEAEYYASASHYIADQIEAHIPAVEEVVVLRRDLKVDLSTKKKVIPVSGYYATPDFFDVFSFKLKKGNSQTTLENPGEIVLTESIAKKLFGDSNPIGKIVTVDEDQDFSIGTITGIVEDPPNNSHLNFEMLVSMKTMESSLVKGRRDFRKNPGQYAKSYVYLVLREDANVEEIESLMAKMMADYNTRKAPVKLLLEPMKDFVVGGAANQDGPTFSENKINMMMGLSLIVLISACFNYTNLSLARVLRRSKEISVRKLTGATRLQIFSQFMTEAVLLSLIALIVGVGIFFIIRLEFLALPDISAGGRTMFLLNITSVQLFYFSLFAIVIGCIAGFLPALFLSKFKASTLFNDAGKVKIFSGASGRHALITCQFTLSISLIMCAVIVHKQYKFALNYDLGYDTENIVNINMKGDYIDLLENEYAKMSEVATTSRSSVILGTRNMMPADAMSEDRSDTIMFSCNNIGSNYLDMYGFKLIAGTGFPDQLKKGEALNNIIVNEGFLKELKLGSPEDAIGKNIWYFDDVKLKIQGVVRDFISMSLDAEAPKAFGFLNGRVNQTKILGVKIASSNLMATIEKLEKCYKELDPVHPFEASFYGDEIARTYEDSKTTYTIISFLAFLAISISTLGLLGMAVFTIESRMKEISIRKVLGADIKNLMLLLSRSFLLLLIIAGVIAIPVTLYIIDDVILNEFLYRTEIGLVETLSGFAIVLFIGFITVGWQIREAAIQNPAELLRNE